MLSSGSDLISAVYDLYLIDCRTELELDFILELFIQVLQDDIVDICSQMAHRGIQQLQLVLHAFLLYVRSRRGIELCSLSAVGQIDLIHILHELNGLALSDILEQGAAEVVGYVVFAI